METGIAPIQGAFPTLQQVHEIFPQVSSQAYVEAMKVKAVALVETVNIQEHSSVTQTSVNGLASVAEAAISANPNLNAVELNYTCTRVEQEGFFTERGKKYKFSGRFDFF